VPLHAQADQGPQTFSVKPAMPGPARCHDAVDTLSAPTTFGRLRCSIYRASLYGAPADHTAYTDGGPLGVAGVLGGFFTVVEVAPSITFVAMALAAF